MGEIHGAVPSSSTTSASVATPNNALLHDFIAVSHDPYLVNNEAGAPSVANIQLVKVPWESTKTITTYMLWQGTTIGTGLTNCYCCAVDSSGAVLAPTADLSATLMAASNGFVSFNAATPTSIPGSTGGWIWLGLQIGAATVVPGFGNWGSTLNVSLTNFNVNGGARSRVGRIATGNAALPGTITPASIVASSVRLLMGVK